MTAIDVPGTGRGRATKLPYRRAAAALVAAAILADGPASADPAAICDRVAAEIAAETGVPREVLMAISLTETGRRREGRTRPWPWTVNMEGEGRWFGNRDAALAYVYKHYKRGARSFDLGCFQINFRWHGQHFDSIDQMFDPRANARYAARFLGDLKAELGDWSRAAGAYHSRTEHYARKYRARFDRYLAELRQNGGQGGGQNGNSGPLRLANAGSGAGAGRPSAANGFPLLRGGSGGARAIGSLVPLGRGAAPLLGARP